MKNLTKTTQIKLLVTLAITLTSCNSSTQNHDEENQQQIGVECIEQFDEFMINYQDKIQNTDFQRLYIYPLLDDIDKDMEGKCWYEEVDPKTCKEEREQFFTLLQFTVDREQDQEEKKNKKFQAVKSLASMCYDKL